MSSGAGWEPLAFYEREEQLSGAYSGDVTEYHRAKASLVEAHCGRRRRVLELGAGGGQMAVATADLGFSVEAVELVPRLAAHARTLAARSRNSEIRIIEGNFYEVAVEGPFGAVCYWDGFRHRQRQRPTDALDPNRRMACRRRSCTDRRLHALVLGGSFRSRDALRPVHRRYEFDPETQTMVDVWWPEGADEEAVAQRLRCYAPEDLTRLLEPVALSLETIAPGGAYDHDGATYRPQVAVEEAMSYTAIISHA